MGSPGSDDWRANTATPLIITRRTYFFGTVASFIESTECTKQIPFGASVCPAFRHRRELARTLRAGGRCNLVHELTADVRPRTARLPP
jgi:hypothetical protein